LEPRLVIGLDMRAKNPDWTRYHRLVAEMRTVMHYYQEGDYYPLTPYSLDNSVWMA
jgi:hypothetical protein